MSAKDRYFSLLHDLTTLGNRVESGPSSNDDWWAFTHLGKVIERERGVWLYLMLHNRTDEEAEAFLLFDQLKDIHIRFEMSARMGQLERTINTRLAGERKVA